MSSVLRPIGGETHSIDGPTYVCFPPAGGTTALFGPLGAANPLADLWGTEYPGRAGRIDAPVPRSLPDLAAGICAELEDRFVPDRLRSSVLVGFSMGALVAFEVALRLRHAPSALVVVGATAPQRRRNRPAELTDDDLMALLHDMPSEVAADPDLLEYVLDVLREDMRLVNAYEGPQEGRVPCDLVAMCGREDPRLGPDVTDSWRVWTDGGFATSVEAGAHLGPLTPSGAAAFWSRLAELGARGIRVAPLSEPCLGVR